MVVDYRSIGYSGISDILALALNMFTSANYIICAANMCNNCFVGAKQSIPN
jgi:hypothetical protein